MKKVAAALLSALAAASSAFAVVSCFYEHQPRPLEGAPVDRAGPFGLDTRPATSPCSDDEDRLTNVTPLPNRTPNALIGFTSITTARLSKPIEIGTRGGKTFVAEQDGVIRWLKDDSAAPIALSIKGRITTGYDQGVLGFALHPNFPAKPYIYIGYTAPHPTVPTPPNISFQCVVARYESLDGGTTFAAASEKRLLVWDHPGVNHNVGALVFGPDGYLYIASGEGADPTDLNYQNGQTRSHLLGKILRIDVDNGDPYAIPPSNPFAAGQLGTRPEIYALGLRNPWRFDFDSKSGRLWAGDVGHLLWEEIDEIIPGGNYGWGNREGHDCFPGGLSCTGDYVAPLLVHSHSEAAALIGGVFYYGTAVPLLTGKYVYGDAQSSRYWAIATDTPTPTPLRLDEDLPKTRPVSLRLDDKGEILVASYSAGKILRIGPPTYPPLRKHLGETGCVEPGDPRIPRPGAIRYDVNVPQWIDGVAADRWLSIPTDGAITIDDAETGTGTGRLTLPPRSVVVKTLFAEGKNLETQLLRQSSNGSWKAETYAWTAEGDTAWLATAPMIVTLPSGRQHHVDPQSCKTCHSAELGTTTTLGLEVAQLDRDDVDYGKGRLGNPIDTLEHIGIITAPVGGGGRRGAFRALPRSDGFDTVEARARAYLHANCAFCHHANADESVPGDGAIDLRFSASLRNMRICNVASPSGRGGFFVPSNPEQSLLVRAMKTTSPAASATEPRRMPYVGTRIADDNAVNLVAHWIGSTGNCP